MEMLESALWVVAASSELSCLNDCKCAVRHTAFLLCLGDVTVYQGLKFGQLPCFVVVWFFFFPHSHSQFS